MVHRTWWCGVACMLGVLACGGDDDPPPADTGPDSDGGTPVDGALADGAPIDATSDGALPDGAIEGCATPDCGGHGECIDTGGTEYCECELGARPEGGSCVPGSDWFGVGGSDLGPWDTRLVPPSSIASGTRPRIVVAADGTIVVGYDTGAGIGVLRWTGTAWEGFGSADSSGPIGAADGSLFDLAVDGTGRPAVAWAESDHTVRFVHWDGATWMGLGGSVTGTPFGGSDARRVALALDASGDPVIAWDAYDSGPRMRAIRVARWDGAAWSGLAGSDGAAGIGDAGSSSDVVQLEVDSAGRLAVLWEYAVPGDSGFIRLRRWDGGAWLPVVVISNAGSSACHDSTLAMDDMDAAVVACWRYVTASRHEVQVTRHYLDGTMASLSSPGAGFTLRMATNRATGDLVVGFSTGLPIVRRLDASGWGEALPYYGVTDDDWDIAAASDGSVLIAAQSRGAIHVRRHAGFDWGALDEDLESIGLSRGPSRAIGGLLALDGSGRGAVVWSSSTPTGYDVHARAVDPGWSWRDLSVLDAIGPPSSPFLYDVAIDDAAAPIVGWVDRGTRTTEAAVWDGSAWQRMTGPATHGFSSGEAYVTAAVASTSAGEPVLAWTEGGRGVVVMRWDGASWVRYGDIAIAASDNSIRIRNVALDGADNPVVAVTRTSSGGLSVAVARFDGADWSMLGSYVTAVSTDVALAVDGTGAPWVAQANSVGVQVRRWATDQWTGADGTGDEDVPGTTGAYQPALAALGDEVFVAWHTGDVLLRVFRAGTWQEIASSATDGGISNSAASSTGSSIAFTDHLICVAWTERLKMTARCAHR